ncbi:MAG: hypothetical protein J7K59_04490 [Candidatus Korarchaeota archaeon]|nr:hypothetical protein [Candidatus Korarchaeota archaeon]
MVKLKILKNLKQIRSNLINFELIFSKLYTRILYLSVDEIAEQTAELLKRIDEIRFLLIDAHKQAKFFLKQQRYKKRKQKEVDYNKLNFLERLDLVTNAMRETNVEAAYKIITKKELQRELGLSPGEFKAHAPIIYEELRKKGAKIDGSWIIFPRRDLK